MARERAITEQKFSRTLRDASVKAFLLKRRANRLRTHSRRTTALNRTCKFYRLNRAARPVAEIIIPVSLRSLPYSLLSNTPLRTTSTTSYTVITPTAFVPLSKVRSSIIESCKIPNCRQIKKYRARKWKFQTYFRFPREIREISFVFPKQ